MNRVRRVQWCRGHLRWTVQNNWRNVLFSDEMKVKVVLELLKFGENEMKDTYLNVLDTYDNIMDDTFLAWCGDALLFMVSGN